MYGKEIVMLAIGIGIFVLVQIMVVVFALALGRSSAMADKEFERAWMDEQRNRLKSSANPGHNPTRSVSPDTKPSRRSSSPARAQNR